MKSGKETKGHNRLLQTGKKTLTPSQKKSKKTFVPPPGYWKANRWFLLIFFVLAFILYGNTLLNKFAIDDEYVTHNSVVKKGLKAIPEIFTTRYIQDKGNVANRSSDYRPVVKLTFALEYQIFGEKPGVSHWINVLIYFALSWLLFKILRRLFKDYNILFPFLITVIFMTHPIHTEVVDSLKNRDEMLAFFFGLAGLHYALNWADTGKIRFIFYTMAAFLTGYLCKTSIVPFLFLYVLVLWFFTNLPPKRIWIVFGAVLLMGLVGHYLPRLFLPESSRLYAYIENPLYFEKDFWLRVGTGFYTILYYLRLLVYPYPLIYYYGYDMIPVTNMSNIWSVISLLLFLALFIYALFRFRRKHILSFAILFYLISIGMYSNFLIPAVGIVAERFVFLASVSFCIALVWFIFKLFKTEPNSLTIEFEPRLKIFALITLIVLPYSFLTVSRNRDWRNLWDLYRTDIKKQDRSAKAHIHVAGYMMQSTFKDENFLRYGSVSEHRLIIIVSHFRQALKIYPNNYQALNDLGTVYLFLAKKYDSAMVFLNKAVALDPSKQPAWVNLGMTYRQLGEYQKALECYQKILDNNPNQLKAVFAMADVYNDMGDMRRAISMNEEVMKQYPNMDMPYINIGNYYMIRGDTAVAVGYWEQAAQRNPSQEVCLQLDYLYRIKGNMEKAEYYYRLSQNAVRK